MIKNLKGKKILVTGAGGYIGTTLVPMLLSEEAKVIAVDRFFFGKDLLLEHKNLTLVKQDSRNIEEELFKDVYAVIDLVAISNDPSGEVFQNATYEINYKSRANTAQIAKRNGVEFYILPSSCSIYGYQEKDIKVTEDAKTNPLTNYAVANEKAEIDVKKLASRDFCVVILRQATVYGLSPRIRFDLAINGMTYGAYNNKKLPLMRDGSQWRPMVHVTDTCKAQIFMLKTDKEKINGEIFNVGSDENNYQLKNLGETVASCVSEIINENVPIEWYGDPDHRSYRVSFEKIEKLGFKAIKKAEDGVTEICKALKEGKLKKNEKSITLNWYQELVKWHRIIKDVELNGKIFD